MKQTFEQTFTLTFGDQAENHVGMQTLGKMAKNGFTGDDLSKDTKAFAKYRPAGVGAIELYDLGALWPFDPVKAGIHEAYVLVIRKGLCALVGDEDTIDDFYQEQLALEKDTKALMYGRVVNKTARHNLCFSEEEQEPLYEEGKGRIIPYRDVPVLSIVRDRLTLFLGNKAEGLCVEGNYYYDPSKCFIGFHGDAERKKVVGVRAGVSFPFHYQWYRDSKPVGRRLEITLNHGDVYIMSEKATGNDWKKKIPPTLRHAAGSIKSLKIDPLGPMVTGCDFLDEVVGEDEPEGKDEEYELDEDGFYKLEFVTAL